jgi:hypothetical protein
MSKYALLACGVFKKEIERIGCLGYDCKVKLLDPGLHVDFDQLLAALSSALDEARASDGTVVAFGACHPQMNEILSSYNAVLLNCQNCVDALIPRAEVERRASCGLYFYLSPGWIECWRDIFRLLGWGMEEARMALGGFRGAVFLDTLGNAGDYEMDILEFFDYTLLLVEVVPAGLDHFRSLLSDAFHRLNLEESA